jgi:saccharopine dehydrogenase-like NADP-dependent oxidoreductase
MTKKIAILGAGLSSTSLINYLLERAVIYDWQIVLGDYNLALAQQKINGHAKGKAIQFDVKNQAQVDSVVSENDLIVSMLPAMFHYQIAASCVKFAKSMLTASYVSPEIKALEDQAKSAGIGIFMELGVDPGIDHMSAMRIIDRLHAEGSEITAFYSSTGGLIAPAYDNNPWNYKFTWNPRNVVLAGQGPSKYIENGLYKYIPYHRLFKNTMQTSIDGVGEFEIYPNRDSLKYRQTYKLDTIPTLLRGTLRRVGFAKAWDVFVQLGATDDTYIMENSSEMTNRQFINTFLPYSKDQSVESKLQALLPNIIDETVMEKLTWLDLFAETPITIEKASPAQILQSILERKWQLDEGDKDMIAMQHRFDFTDANHQMKQITSSLVVFGESKETTAMAITVGIPLAIATKMVALEQLVLTGIQVPVTKEIYEPILDELKEFGIEFNEKEITI